MRSDAEIRIEKEGFCQKVLLVKVERLEVRQEDLKEDKTMLKQDKKNQKKHQ